LEAAWREEMFGVLGRKICSRAEARRKDNDIMLKKLSGFAAWREENLERLGARQVDE